MTQAFFITGTDTEVGKTQVTAALLTKAKQAGYSSLGFKPVASGCQVRVNKFNQQEIRNSDALLLQEASSLKLAYQLHNPFAFVPAIAPHLAAQEVGVELNLVNLQQAYHQALAQQPDLLLIEGAGGWLTPLNTEHSLADFVLQLGLPVILVVGLKLGCINHALLTAKAIQNKGLPLAGWIANACQPSQAEDAAVSAYLTQKLSAPCLAQLPFINQPTPEALAKYCPNLAVS